jgi:hypothetical protein
LCTIIFFCLVQFEYLNPLVGLAMFIIGMFVILFGYFIYGIVPVIVGLVLVAYYRKYLFRLLMGF